MRTATALMAATLMACSSSEQAADDADSGATTDAPSDTASDASHVDSGSHDAAGDVRADSVAADSTISDAPSDTATSDTEIDAADVHDGDVAPIDAGSDVGPADASDSSDADAFTGCVIDSVAYASGAASPSGCGTCAPSTSTTTWTPLAKGTPCASGDYCDGGDACVPACVVGGTFYAAGAADPSSTCQRCDPSKSTSAFSASFFQPYQSFETWPSAPSGASVFHLVAADFDHDTYSDVVASESAGQALALLTGRASGGLAAPVRTSTPGFYGTSLATADMNKDTWPDVVALYPNSTFQLYTGASGGVLTASGSTVGTYAFSNAVAIADTNGDGSLDVAANGGSGTGAGLVAYYPASAGGFTSGPTHTLGTYVPVFALADVDGDGKTDLAMGDAYSGPELYLSKTGFGFGATGRTEALAFADLDGDKVPDLVFGDGGSVPGGFQITVFLLSTSGTVVKSQTLPGLYASAFGFGDVDRDGKPDIVYGGSRLGVLLNRSTTGAPSFTMVEEFPTPVTVGSLAPGDFDGDGALDVAVAGPKTSVTVLYGCK